MAMNPDPNTAFHRPPYPGPAGPSVVPRKAPFGRYLLAHLLTGVLFLVWDIVTPSRNPTTVTEVLVHLLIPAVLSALVSWALTRRARLPFWAIALLALPFFAGVLFVYEMALLMASTQQ
jgi:hypothetical protein